jgi:hypothetical protein
MKRLFLILSGAAIIISAAVLTLFLLKPWEDSALSWPNSPSPGSSQAPEVRGNSISNSLNGGYVAQDGDWVYFAAGAKYDHTLHKMLADGTDKQPIGYNSVNTVHIIDGWIHFTDLKDRQSLYKMRTDGSGRTKLNDDSSLNVSVVDGWIYYINYGRLEEDTYNTRNFYKIDIDGNNRTKVIDDSVTSATVTGGWIYYSTETGIFKRLIDGTKNLKISDAKTGGLHIEDDWIYYRNSLASGPLCRMRLDGTEKETLDDRGIVGINVYNGWIYYVLGSITSGGWELYRIRLDGTDMESLGVDSCYDLIIHDDWIYYIRRVERGIYHLMYESEIWRVRTDGKDNQKVG